MTLLTSKTPTSLLFKYCRKLHPRSSLKEGLYAWIYVGSNNKIDFSKQSHRERFHTKRVIESWPLCCKAGMYLWWKLPHIISTFCFRIRELAQKYRAAWRKTEFHCLWEVFEWVWISRSNRGYIRIQNVSALLLSIWRRLRWTKLHCEGVCCFFRWIWSYKNKRFYLCWYNSRRSWDKFIPWSLHPINHKRRNKRNKGKTLYWTNGASL